MIPRVYIYLGAALAIIAGGLWYRAHLIQVGDDRGSARVQARWDADTEARRAATAKALAEAAAREKAALETNTEVLRDTNAKLMAIAADRDSLGGMLQSANDRIRRLAARAASSESGADEAAGIASRAIQAQRAIAEQWDRLDRACQSDAVRFAALQEQLRPQL